MKTLILVMGLMLAVTGVARADVISVYSDPSGANCSFTPGFHTNIHIIHKFTLGATASQFKVVFPAGSSLFAFEATPGFTAVGPLTSDIIVAYGDCLTGHILVGSAVAVLGAGLIVVEPADTEANVQYADCSMNAHPAVGGVADVGTSICFCCVATEPTTWGEVKALYR